MSWIESHQTLREHPKTKRLCRLLTLDRWQAVGLLQFLWWWALDYAPEGDLSGFSDEDIADAVDWTEDAGRLMEGLIEAGFVDEGRHIHDWEMFAEKRIERRRANAARMKASRDRVRMPIYERDGGCCRYCGRPVPRDDFIVDHVFPMRRGGSDDPSNLATACGPCNTRKNNRTPDEAGMPLLPLTVCSPRAEHTVTTSGQSVGLPERPERPERPEPPPKPPPHGGDGNGAAAPRGRGARKVDAANGVLPAPPPHPPPRASPVEEWIKPGHPEYSPLVGRYKRVRI